MLGRLSSSIVLQHFSKNVGRYRSFSLVEQRNIAIKLTNKLNTTLTTEQIDNTITTIPILSNVPIETWRTIHCKFINNGMRTQQFLDIISKNPNLLLKDTDLTTCFELWRSCQFGEKQLNQLFVKYPMLLELTNEHELLLRVTFLRQFVGTTKNVWRLFMNSPNLLEQPNTKDIEKIFEYLCNRMRIDIPEIVKSNVFTLKLNELQTRHIFLERLGLFKPRSLKQDPNLPSKNPRLHQITDTTNEEFVKKICGVKLLEFESFIELYAKELEHNLDHGQQNANKNLDNLDENNEDENIEINLL